MHRHLLARAARRRAVVRLFSGLTLGLAACLVAVAQPWTPGQSYFGRNNYIEYRAGNLPIILIAGHGGTLEPNEIPDRNGSGDVTSSDRRTIELAEAIADLIFARTDRRPHLIFNHLHRKKLDPNREILEAARGNEFAEQAWHEFHDYIEIARGLAEEQFGFGFVADMHGHGHPIFRVELGYNLNGADLRQSDNVFNRPGYTWMSYFRTLMLHRPGLPFHTLIRGPGSFGDLINLNGAQKAWPRPDFPAPSSGDEFFAGGYNTDTHTCRLDNALINGIQFECHYDGLRDTATNRAAFAAQFVAALQPFLYNHYGYSLGTRSLFTLQDPATTLLARGGSALTLTINRTGTINYAATLPLGFSGTAVLDVDYTASANSVTFASGETSRTITLTPAAAAGAVGDRSIIVQLAPPVTEAADTTPITLTLADAVSQTVRVHALAPAVDESTGVARFRLTRTQTGSTLSVPLTWSGTALPEADFFAAPATAEFAANAHEIEVAVPLVDDGRAEPNKTLTLELGNGAAYLVGLPASATITLRDDDRPAGLAVWLRGEIANNVVPDASGTDRHGTSLPANQPGVSGPSALTLEDGVPAINFDGTNDTFALPRFRVDPQGEFTLAFFFRLNTHSNAPSSQSLVSYGDRGDPNSLHIYLNGSSTVALRTNLPSLSSSALDLTSGIAWQDNTWRHYTLTVGANGTCRVMVHDLDGNLLAQRTATGRTGQLAANQLFWFGWRPQERQNGGYMRGALRDIRIYQRALDTAEIVALASERQTYAAWLAGHSQSSATAPGSDADGDGVPALVEYATAARIGASEPVPRYAVTTTNDRLALTFLRETNAGDLAWHVEASNDLANWQTLATRTANASDWTIVTPGVSVEEVNGFVTATDAIAASPARFLRLRIER